MSQRSRRASTSVSLFPFLAVLVCAMGALILLLLVTTRRVRQQVIASQMPPIMETVETSRPVPRPVRTVDPEKAALRAKQIAAHEADQQRLEEEWLDHLAQLQAVRDQKLNEQRQQQQRLQTIQKGLELARAELLTTESQTNAVRQAVLAEKENENEAKAEVQALTEDIKFAEQQIQMLRKQRADAQSQFAFIPYDGESGTTRRPIYVECTGAGLRILPEDEVLRGRDLSGFTERYNPLLLGVESLMSYWAGQASLQPDKPDTEPPYVLLLVRPTGSRTFYVARQLLARLGQPYGYELVEENYPLYMPPPDPQAKLVLKTTIEQTLRDRKEVLEDISGRRRNIGKIIEFDAFGSGRGEWDGESTSGEGGRGSLGEEEFGDGNGNEARSSGNGSSGITQRGTRGRGTGTRSGRISGGQLAGSSFGNAQVGSRGTGGLGSRGTGTSQAGSPSSTGNKIGGGEAPYAGIGLGPETDGFGNENGESGGRSLEGRESDGGEFANDPNQQGNGFSEQGPVLPGATGPRGRQPQTSRLPRIGRNAPRRRTGAKPGMLDGQAGQIEDLGGTGDTAFPELTEGEFGNTARRSSGTRSSAATSSRSNGPQNANPTGTNPPGTTAGGQSSGSGDPQGGGGPPQIVQFGPKKKTAAGREGLPRKWGPARRGMIGFEKTVIVKVTPDRLIIGNNEFEIPVGRGESREDLVNDLVGAIEQHSQGWGEPPANFYWIPAVKFRVYPGGISHYERVHPQLRELGLFSKVDFAVDQKPPEDAKGVRK